MSRILPARDPSVGGISRPRTSFQCESLRAGPAGEVLLNDGAEAVAGEDGAVAGVGGVDREVAEAPHRAYVGGYVGAGQEVEDLAVVNGVGGEQFPSRFVPQADAA